MNNMSSMICQMCSRLRIIPLLYFLFFLSLSSFPLRILPLCNTTAGKYSARRMEGGLVEPSRHLIAPPPARRRSWVSPVVAHTFGIPLAATVGPSVPTGAGDSGRGGKDAGRVGGGDVAMSPMTKKLIQSSKFMSPSAPALALNQLGLVPQQCPADSTHDIIPVGGTVLEQRIMKFNDSILTATPSSSSTFPLMSSRDATNSSSSPLSSSSASSSSAVPSPVTASGSVSPGAVIVTARDLLMPAVAASAGPLALSARPYRQTQHYMLRHQQVREELSILHYYINALLYAENLFLIAPTSLFISSTLFFINSDSEWCS